MLNRLKKEEKIELLIYVIIAITGLIFCILKDKVLETIKAIIAFLFMIYGVFLIIIYCSQQPSKRNIKIKTDGILFSVAGLTLNVFPELFAYGVGVLILSKGVYEVVNILQKRYYFEPWRLKFSFSLVSVIIGLICVILTSFEISSKVANIALGITLLIEAIKNIVEFIILRILSNDKESDDEDEPKKDSNKFLDDYKDYTIT